jgi:hypothetical protein
MSPFAGRVTFSVSPALRNGRRLSSRIAHRTASAGSRAVACSSTAPPVSLSVTSRLSSPSSRFALGVSFGFCNRATLDGRPAGGVPAPAVGRCPWARQRTIFLREVRDKDLADEILGDGADRCPASRDFGAEGGDWRAGRPHLLSHIASGVRDRRARAGVGVSPWLFGCLAIATGADGRYARITSRWDAPLAGGVLPKRGPENVGSRGRPRVRYRSAYEVSC